MYTTKVTIGLLVWVICLVLAILYFGIVKEKEIVSKDSDTSFTKSVLNSFSEVSKGNIDIRTAVCMISDLHESAIKAAKDEADKSKSESVRTWAELEELKKTFEAYRETLGDTDLYKTTHMSVQITKTRPADWKNTVNDHVASVSANLSHWLNKWTYVPGIGIVFCCEVNSSTTYSMEIFDESAEVVDSCISKDVVLLGQRVIKEEEISSIQEMWNSKVD